MGITATLGVVKFAYDENKRAQEELIEAQEKQMQAEQNIQNERAARERRKQISQRQVLQAQIQNQAAQQGQGASSAAIVGQTDVASNTGTNVAQINTDVALSDKLFGARKNVLNAGRLSTAGRIATGITNVGLQAAGSYVAGPAGGAAATSIFQP